MRILGIDPGVATVGFGLVESNRGQLKLAGCGVITTPAHTPLSSRLDQIYTDLEELIGAYHPDAIPVEELFFSKNITTGIAVAHSRGSSSYALAGLACRCTSTPHAGQQAVVG